MPERRGARARRQAAIGIHTTVDDHLFPALRENRCQFGRAMLFRQGFETFHFAIERGNGVEIRVFPMLDAQTVTPGALQIVPPIAAGPLQALGFVASQRIGHGQAAAHGDGRSLPTGTGQKSSFILQAGPQQTDPAIEQSGVERAAERRPEFAIKHFAEADRTAGHPAHGQPELALDQHAGRRDDQPSAAAQQAQRLPAGHPPDFAPTVSLVEPAGQGGHMPIPFIRRAAILFPSHHKKLTKKTLR